MTDIKKTVLAAPAAARTLRSLRETVTHARRALSLDVDVKAPKALSLDLDVKAPKALSLDVDVKTSKAPSLDVDEKAPKRRR